jgi:hypothetical protein
MEIPSPTFRRRVWSSSNCVSLPTWNQQVEQDRAPDVLVHQYELAWATLGELRGRRQPYRGDSYEDWPTEGLRITAKLDPREYETGEKITDEQMQQINIEPHKTQPKWNYTISNRRPRSNAK